MQEIRLISTDFDGTLIGDSDEGCSIALARTLEEHRAGGGLWAVNTGRGLAHAVDGLRRLRSPVAPDFLLTNERDVFRWDGRAAWLAHGDWNDRCRLRHDELHDLAADVYRSLERMARRTGEFRLVYEEKRPAGLVADSEEILERLVGEIDRIAEAVEDFHYQRNSIYLRFCHREYHKGSALGELCRLEGIDVGEVFAVGDHFNDIPMLDGRHAAKTACPANAIPQVKETVRLSVGYVARSPWAEGVAEALRHYRNAAPAEVGIRP